MVEALTIIGLLALPTWFAWLFFKGTWRGYSTTAQPTSHHHEDRAKPGKRAYLLKAAPIPDLVQMNEATSRFFTY